MFRDRTEAGERLAQRLQTYRDANPVILALPRGGLPVARVAADRLAAPLDVILVRKIGAPGHKELAIGALVDGDTPEMVLNDDVVRLLNLPAGYLETETATLLEEIERRRNLYCGAHQRVGVQNKTAIVIDDGIATGATVKAALRATRKRQPKCLVLAVPVAPQDSLEELAGEADKIVCLETPSPFMAVSVHYGAFPQVADDEVVALLSNDQAHRG